MRGTITNISYGDKRIIFELEVKTFFTEEQCKLESFNYLGNTDDGTIVEIDVISWDDELSEEEKVKTVIPFQLAYAISIHKAQGLEYNSVFYTAITRAKEKLKIFWSPETMKSIVEGFYCEGIEKKSLPIIKKELYQ